jgi:hypothetical protein
MIEELEVRLEGFLVPIVTGNRNDGDPLKPWELAQHLRYLATVEVRQLKIQKDDLRSEDLRNRQCFPPPMDDKHFVAP